MISLVEKLKSLSATVFQTVPKKLKESRNLVLQNPKLRNSKLANSFILQSFGFFRVPFIFLAGARIAEIDEQKVTVKIPLNLLTKNHLKKRTMYFGVLSAGADCAAGFAAMRSIMESRVPIELVFQNFKAQFEKKAQGDVFFSCTQVQEIKALVEQAKNTTERLSLPVQVTAFANGQTVAQFELTLSLKQKV